MFEHKVDVLENNCSISWQAIQLVDNSILFYSDYFIS